MSLVAPEVLAREVSLLYTCIFCTIGATALLVYDWFLTLEREVALLWAPSRKLTGASVLYALSRYIPLFQGILQVVTISPMHLLTSCKAIVWLGVLCNVALVVVSATFSAARVYALSRGKWRPAVLIFLLSFVAIVTNLLIYAKWISIEILPAPFYCSAVDTMPTGLDIKFVIINRGTGVVADALVSIFTWRYTYHSVRMQRGLKFGQTLTHCMFYYGILYFIVLASLNTLQMVLSALAISQPFSVASYVNLFIDSLTSILVSRFLLNLRQVDRGPENESVPSFVDPQCAMCPSSKRASTPSFIASLGTPVHGSFVHSTATGIEDEGDYEEPPSRNEQPAVTSRGLGVERSDGEIDA